jgi:hypothetical protein
MKLRRNEIIFLNEGALYVIISNMKFAHRGKEMHECALDSNIMALAYRRRQENATNYILKIEIFVSILLKKELTEAYVFVISCQV